MKDSSIIKNYSPKDYCVSCIICGKPKALMMFAHRNKFKQIVGWIFCCDNCKDKIVDKPVRLMVTEEKEL